MESSPPRAEQVNREKDGKESDDVNGGEIPSIRLLSIKRVPDRRDIKKAGRNCTKGEPQRERLNPPFRSPNN